jgi:hypothetical protein
MTLLLVLLFLLPWSIWRQMRAHEITPAGLVKLPLIFAAIGALGLGTRELPTDRNAIAYLAFSLVLSLAFGVWRGARVSVWRDASGALMSQGNRTTIALWVALLSSKFVLGAFASITHWFPAEHAGEIFLFLAFSFVAQNVVVAHRSLWANGSTATRSPRRARATAHARVRSASATPPA